MKFNYSRKLMSFRMQSIIIMLLSLIIQVFLSNTLIAQNFSISEIDASKFPKISTSFVALNAANNSYSSLTFSDFNVVDNGKNVNSTVDITCSDELGDVSIMLIIDQSESMNEYISTTSKEKRKDWVIEGVKKFDSAINLVNQTKISLYGFGAHASLICPFTQNKAQLADSLKKILFQSTTDYNTAFIGGFYTNYGTYPDYNIQPIGAVKYIVDNTSPSIRRVIVFLTDGQPSFPVLDDTILRALSSANIQVYGIILGQPINDDLNAITTKSGGKCYAVYTKEDLDNIYQTIAADLQTKKICKLTWEVPYGCSELDRYHNVAITFTPPDNKADKITINSNYTAPESSIASVDAGGSIFYLGNPTAENSSTQDIVYSPKNSQFIINSINTLPNTYFNVIQVDHKDIALYKLPDTISVGSSRTFTIQFTQHSLQTYRSAALVTTGTPCPPDIDLVGGSSQIQIINPVGGEMFSTCDTIHIKWAGLEPSQKIALMFSSDNGSNWHLITNKGYGLEYSWLPPYAGTKYLISAMVTADSKYLWVNSYGATYDEEAASIAATYNHQHIYVAGNFQDSTTFVTNDTLASYGGKDILLLKVDSDGNVITAVQAGSSANDSATGIAIDPSNNIYIVGECQDGAKFGSTIINTGVGSSPMLFVAKYGQDLKTAQVQTIAANYLNPTFQAWGTEILWDYTTNQIYVQGYYTGGNTIGSFIFPKKSNPTKFQAIYNSSFMLTDVKFNGIVNYSNYSSNVCSDSIGNTFETGYFQNSATIRGTKLTSNGKSDIYIDKYGTTPGSTDTINSTFDVEAPSLSFTLNSVDIGTVQEGTNGSIKYSGLLCNVGQLPIQITSSTITGDYPSDFQLGYNLIDSTLQKGECMDIVIVFTPTDKGARSAILTVGGTCASPVSLLLNGTGKCGISVIDTVSFPMTKVGITETQIIENIINNTNFTDILITPSIIGANPGDFKIVNPTGQFIVPARSSYTMTISFTPTLPGVKTAAILYTLPTFCDSNQTALNGIGLSTDIDVRNYDWFERRIITVNDSTAIVRNKMAIPIKILSITSPKTTQFTAKLPSTFPITVAAYDSISFPISFLPDGESDFYDTLTVTVETFDAPAFIPLHGKGILPKLQASWLCGSPIMPGKSSQGTLSLYNPSTTADLQVFSIDFNTPNSNEYKWTNGQPLNITVTKGTTTNIPVTFTPSLPGIRSQDITIISDSARGPVVTPHVPSILTFACESINSTVTQSADFGTLLLCDNYNENLGITNSASETSMTITGYTITATNSEDTLAFTLPSDLTGTVIKPGETKEFSIQFSPAEERCYEAEISFINSYGAILKSVVKGCGTNIHLYTNPTEFSAKPSESIKVPVYAQIPALTNTNVKDITVKITYKDNMLLFNKIDVVNYPGWNWGQTTSGFASPKTISGSGSLATPFDNKLFTIDYVVYLSDVKTSDLLLKNVFSTCITNDTLVANVTLSNFCFSDGMLIKSTGNEYYMLAPDPNPIINDATLNFSIGLDAQTNIDIYNNLGEKVNSLVNQELKAGKYEINLNKNDYSSGFYIIRIQSGPFSDTKKLMISK